MFSRIKNYLLDFTIYYSFDRRGYKRHKDLYFIEEEFSFQPDQRALVTGGTSGIGYAVARTLTDHQINVVVTGRNRERGRKVEESDKKIHFCPLDLEKWEAFSKFVEDGPLYDYVVLNAGAMPEEFKSNQHEVESQAASQLFGHYYLLKLLQEKQKLAPAARIVWVTSGGMYLKSFNADYFFKASIYEKVAVYANVKRAQVEMLKSWAEEFSPHLLVGMHPGWVGTSGLKEALGMFSSWMGDKLRTPKEGADTIIWLMGTQKKLNSGELYFDRKKVRKNLMFIHKSNNEDSVNIRNLLKRFQIK
jgi:dehydrogenase/reductase SDR family member 12